MLQEIIAVLAFPLFWAAGVALVYFSVFVKRKSFRIIKKQKNDGRKLFHVQRLYGTIYKSWREVGIGYSSENAFAVICRIKEEELGQNQEIVYSEK